MISSLSELVSQFTGYPEHMAVVNDDIEALNAALAAVDGDCDVEHHDGNTPLMFAIRLHRTRMVEHLISVGANVNFASTAVVAAAHGNERIMAMLLAAGAAVRTDLYHTNMLFDCAAQNADAGVLRVLVGAGAPVDEPNARGKLPIDFAAENENEEVLSVLLAAGCSVKSSADLAVLAARNRNQKVLAMLMKAGVDINKCDQKSSFPIHHAAQNPNVAVVRLLIDAGVEVNVLDRNDENPLFSACTNPNMEVLDALLAAGAEWVEVSKLRSICHAVALNTNEAIVRRVIERGFDVNARESNGMTPLMFAAESSTAAVVSVFLEAGADVHATDEEQRTVGNFACLNKNVGIMRVLIAAGARVDVDLLKPPSRNQTSMWQRRSSTLG